MEDIQDCDRSCSNDDLCNLFYRSWIALNSNNATLVAVSHDRFCTQWLAELSEIWIFDIATDEVIIPPALLNLFSNVPIFFDAILQDPTKVFDPAFCEILIGIFDWNEDGYINFREYSIFAAYLMYNPTTGLSGIEKAIGVNCSSCVGMETYDIDMSDN